MKFRSRLSLTWLEDRSNPSTLDGLGDTTPPPYDPGSPPAQQPPVQPAPTAPGVPPVVDPVPPYGTP
jgi:hypothetical protein